MSALARRIKDWRGRTTQVKACKKLGVSQATLSDWENGLVVPADAALRRMARVLRVPRVLLLIEASEAALERASL